MTLSANQTVTTKDKYRLECLLSLAFLGDSGYNGHAFHVLKRTQSTLQSSSVDKEI